MHKPNNDGYFYLFYRNGLKPSGANNDITEGNHSVIELQSYELV